MKDESPYCKVCQGCGIDACCPATKCTQSKDGEFCETYLQDLKFGYLMYRDMYSLLKDDEENHKEYDRIFNENFDLIYK
jgi:hypothetical protein